MKSPERVVYFACALSFTALALTACGGGGNSGPAAVPNNAIPQQPPGLSGPFSQTGTDARTALGLAASSPLHFHLTVSAGAKTCLPKAFGQGIISSLGSQVEKLHVDVFRLPPNTDFDLFIIQVPTAPFGLAWYQGDIDTGATGVGSQDFVGRFSIETFIVAPGVAPAPVVFTKTPFPDVSMNPKTGPVHEYHVGLWFNSPADAKKAGCPATVTPFNGTHNAGIQVLNTAEFPNNAGPLIHFHP